MGGAVKSLGGFLGFDTGDKAPEGNFANAAMSQLQDRAGLGLGNSADQGEMRKYLEGGQSLNDLINVAGRSGSGSENWLGMLAENPLIGGRMATQEVQNNPILGSLFGKGGALESSLQKEQELQKQGFQLQPEDHEAYGQASGNIARLFGQQENQLAQSLANRGLGAAPSGAAGASFSGLAGNKNEQLARAQMQIANQRMQNTMNRISQQQQFASQLGGQAQNAINSQRNAQLAGAAQRQGNVADAAQLQNQTNQMQNQYGMQKAEFDAANQPANFMDMAIGGLGSAAGKVGGALGESAGAKYAKSLFG